MIKKIIAIYARSALLAKKNRLIWWLLQFSYANLILILIRIAFIATETVSSQLFNVFSFAMNTGLILIAWAVFNRATMGENDESTRRFLGLAPHGYVCVAALANLMFLVTVFSA